MGRMHVLLTGAAGFIGSHIAESLVARGDSVVGFDNFDSFYSAAIKRRNLLPALSCNGYAFIEGDLRKDDDLAKAFAAGPFDAVVHLAARPGVHPSIQQPLLYEEINVGGTTALLQHVRLHRTTHFLFASSSSVYGATCRPPFRESEAADRPSSPYASTKRSGEMSCYSFHHVYGLDVTCVRYFTAYGPRQRPEMAIHRFTRLIDQGRPVEIYGDGSVRRDFTYISDIVDGTLRAIDRPRGYQIYNLGTTSVASVLEVVEMLGEQMGREVYIQHQPAQAGDVPVTCADISKAQVDLGYAPQISLRAGLDRFVAWYKASSSGVATVSALP